VWERAITLVGRAKLVLYYVYVVLDTYTYDQLIAQDIPTLTHTRTGVNPSNAALTLAHAQAILYK